MNRRRISRALVAVLLLTLCVGGGVYGLAHHLFHSNPNTAKVDKLSRNSMDALMALNEQPTTRSAAGSSSPHGASSASGSHPTGPGHAQPAQYAMGGGAALPQAQTGAPGSGAAILAQASKLSDAGNLLGARKLLNDALFAGTIDPDSAKAAMGQLNKTLVFSPTRFQEDPFASAYTVRPGDTLNRIAYKFDVTPQLLLRVNGMADARRLQAGKSIKVIQGPFHALVTKSRFTLDLYLGGAPGEKGAMYVCTYRVGLGRDDSTPTGIWIVEPRHKLINPKYYSPRGEGTVEAGDPKNPLGKFWIGLQGMDGQAVGKLSYGIHGTIDPDSIGKQSSMGCIRMHNEDVAVVYEMLVEGKSTVIVK